MVVSLAIGPSETADLVALGWLRVSDRSDKNAVTRALTELTERAIRVRVTPSMGSEEGKGFFCEIKSSTIDALVTFGWLPADQQDDLSAITKAFRRFAGRALAVARNCGLDRWYVP